MATGIQIKLDVTRDEVTPHLRRLAAKMGSLQGPLRLIGSALATETRQRFALSRGPIDAIGGPEVPWPPLAPATIAKRRKHSDKPLLDTTTLLRSIHHQEDATSVAVGTNHELAPGVSPAIHQLGGQAGRNRAVTIPPRPFLGVDSHDQLQIDSIINGYLGGPL